ncbi:MAG: MBL fold metallo-hydrolase [Propionibacteriaceae bacterium]|nr:MBL fold metallo-hydrolase [Propionibacteriaceae bacterium]
MVDFRLGAFTSIADRVWIAPAEPESVNIGLVAGESHGLLIDTGSSPQQGAQIRRAAEATAGVPLCGVFVTHDHYDHIGGLAAFDDLPSYAHESVASASERFALVKSIELGSRQVELAYFGQAHTFGDVVAVVPDADVIFVGDLLESLQPLQFDTTSSFSGWVKALDGVCSMLSSQTCLIVGHGEVVGRDFAFEQRSQLAMIVGNVEYLLQQHIPSAEALTAGLTWPYDHAVIEPLLPQIYAEIQKTLPRHR